MTQRRRRNLGAKTAILPLVVVLGLGLAPLGPCVASAFAPLARSRCAPDRFNGLSQFQNPRVGASLHNVIGVLGTNGDVAIGSPERAARQPWSALAALPGPAESLLSLFDSTPGALGRALCVLSGASALAVYHARQYALDRSGKSKSWCSHQADVRERWARHVRDTEGWLYAVQTLRNAITTNTFLATTMITLLTLISGKIWDLLRSTPLGTPGRKTLMVKFGSVALCMLASAYHFLQSARLMTHAGFMFPVQPRKTLADAIMRRSQITQWLGLRWMYISLSALSWTVVGEQACIATSLALLLFFRNIDRVPVGVEGVRVNDYDSYLALKEWPR